MLNLTPINCNVKCNDRKAKSNQQTTIRSVQMCAHCTVHNCCTQNRPDNFPSYIQTIIIATMTSM